MRMNAYYDEALQVFARRQGTYYWKAALRHAWETGHYPGFLATDVTSRLQELRNMAAFGPAGLVKYRLPRIGREDQG